MDASDVIFETTSGEFSFDAASGGILAVIDLAWQLTLCSKIYAHFAVIIDEPENHLHPLMQRSLFSDFMRAFPQAQFITATHSPLVVSSAADSNVYVLDYNEERGVESHKLDLVNRAGTSNEILRNVLGVPVTMPEWAEEKLEGIVQSYSDKEVTGEMLTTIRKDMEQFGIEELFPQAVERVMEQKRDSD